MKRAAVNAVLIVILVSLAALLGVVLKSEIRSRDAVEELKQHQVAILPSSMDLDSTPSPSSVDVLEFRNQNVAPSVLENAIWLSNLRMLFFEECSLRSDCANVLKRLVQVENLAFVRCEINADVLFAMSTLPELRHVNFMEMDLGSEHFSAVESSGRIRALTCRGSRLSANIGNTIASAGLEVVFLNETNATDELLLGIENCRTLQYLYLAKTEVTDATVQRLSRNPALSSLDLTDTNVTDHALESVADMPALEILVLDGTRVTLAGVADLLEKRRFRRLSFTCPESEWEACDVLHRRFPELAVTRDSASNEETESPAD